LRSGHVKLALQIGASNVDVAHRHLGLDVPAPQLINLRVLIPFIATQPLLL